MTRISPPSTQAVAPALESLGARAVGTVGAPNGPVAPAPAAALATAAAPNAVVAAAFERLRGAARIQPDTSVELLVGEAVRATLDSEFGGVAALVRQRVAGEITQVLLDDPTLRVRLERLMGSES